MQRLIYTLVSLMWGLWLGGLVMLFLAVTSLFKTFPRETAGQGAAPIFHLFNAYQLGLAALALIATFVWRLVGPPKRTTWLFAFFAVATLLGCFVAMYLAPKIELLQHQGQSQSELFKRYHGWSMAAYGGEVIALVIAGFILPWARESKATS
jgi:hypothetical protein